MQTKNDSNKTPIKLEFQSKEFKRLITKLKGKKFDCNSYSDVHYLKEQINNFFNQEPPSIVISKLIRKYNCPLSNSQIAFKVEGDCSKSSITKLKNAKTVNYSCDKCGMQSEKIRQLFRVITTDYDTGYPMGTKREERELEMSIDPYLRLELVIEKFELDTSSCKELKEFCRDILERLGISTKSSNRGRPRKQ